MTRETLQCYVFVTLAPASLMGHLVSIEMSTDSSQDTFCPNLKAWSCSVLCQPLVQRLADVRKAEVPSNALAPACQAQHCTHLPWALSHDTATRRMRKK